MLYQYQPLFPAALSFPPNSMNEEFVSGNEELQSMNEELETAKEELQSTNEELTTVNDALQTRNQDTSEINTNPSTPFTSTTKPKGSTAIILPEAFWPFLYNLSFSKTSAET